MTIGIIGLLSIIVWYMAVKELSKPEKNQSNRKIITLTSSGTLLTLILTVSLFQNFNFFGN
ncbi:hypothetical protein [Planococcus beigongshangi]|uniref:hypothetical protein n=1 Tax=Planococcus beigongshangi TaxID=2782536 RepID=UPI00193AE919|nr:hypothetical protein [Planococcus beigongshangi]